MLAKKGTPQDAIIRDFALEKIVDKALTVVNTAVTKACDSEGIDIDRLFESLGKRSADAEVYNAELSSAVSHVATRFTEIFGKLKH
jgi:hypothetical protein